MNPPSGKTLPHERNVEKIGAGGMGEVYRARFERKAKSLGSVKPPNHAGLRSPKPAADVTLPLVALLLTLVGCTTAGTQVVARQRAYDPLEYAPYQAHGTAELSGQAFTKTRQGDVVFAVEESVYLFPATPYTDEWWKRTLVEGAYLTEPDARSLAFLHTSIADEQGYFRFRSLPAGDYYVVCTITWKEGLVGSTPHWERYSTTPALHVANLGRRVHLGSGQKADVLLETVSSHRALVDPPPAGPTE